MPAGGRDIIRQGETTGFLFARKHGATRQPSTTQLNSSLDNLSTHFKTSTGCLNLFVGGISLTPLIADLITYSKVSLTSLVVALVGLAGLTVFHASNHLRKK